MGIPGFEIGNTPQFTFVSSIQPDAAPIFSVTDRLDTMIHSETAQTSNATSYYALFTLPNSHGAYYVGQWVAIKTVAGSARNFTKRFGFLGTETRVEV